MQTPRDVLTPDSLSMLQAIASAGSFAAAAREMGMVPSALTYRVRQIEDALDVLLFDRSSRQARVTDAGAELLREGERLLADIDAVANRVKRVATGWEPQLTITVDTVIDKRTVLELCESFLAQSPPTRIKLREETLTGTIETLVSGQADIALGVAMEAAHNAGLQCKPIGHMNFVFAMAPHHPLASEPEPLVNDVIARHRAVAVADTLHRGQGLTFGILDGQDVFTVATMQDKLEAQLRGLGVGNLPACMAGPHLDSGRLVARKTERATRQVQLSYAWRGARGSGHGKAMKWWLKQLESPATRAALLHQHEMATGQRV